MHAFLFDTPAQKRALMGAGHTFIAKPWRREIYLQHDAWPHEVTKHELAHVFAGPFGDPIFGIARRGLAFNVGLIEGVAVAAAWAGQPLTPHQMVKILRDAKLVDERTLPSVMGPSFFGLNAAQAYNLAGSFCRFLVDTRGVDKLEALYRAAGTGDSWRRIYGVELADACATSGSRSSTPSQCRRRSARWRSSGSSGRASSGASARTRRRCASRRRKRRRRPATARARSPSGTRCAPRTTRPTMRSSASKPSSPPATTSWRGRQLAALPANLDRRAPRARAQLLAQRPRRCSAAAPAAYDRPCQRCRSTSRRRAW